MHHKFYFIFPLPWSSLAAGQITLSFGLGDLSAVEDVEAGVGGWCGGNCDKICSLWCSTTFFIFGSMSSACGTDGNLFELQTSRKTYFLSFDVKFLSFVLQHKLRFTLSEVVALLLLLRQLSLLVLLLQRLLDLLLRLQNLFFVDQIQNLIQLLLIELDIFLSDCFDDLKWNEN